MIVVLERVMSKLKMEDTERFNEMWKREDTSTQSRLAYLEYSEFTICV